MTTVRTRPVKAGLCREYHTVGNVRTCYCHCGRPLLIMDLARSVDYSELYTLNVLVHPDGSDTPTITGRCATCRREHSWSDIAISGLAKLSRVAVVEHARDAWRKKWGRTL